MSGPVDRASSVSALVDPPEINHDALAGLIARALAQAQIAAIGLREAAMPAWSPSRRSFPAHLAGRLEDGRIFDDAFIDDLTTFLEMLVMKIDHGTHTGWEADEHHVRGGYEVVYADDETRALTHCASALCRARSAICAALSAARSIHLVEDLLDA